MTILEERGYFPAIQARVLNFTLIRHVNSHDCLGDGYIHYHKAIANPLLELGKEGASLPRIFRLHE